MVEPMNGRALLEPRARGPASSGMAMRPRRIGVLTDNLANSYSDSILDEVCEVAREHGIEVICLVGGLTESPPKRRMISDLAHAQCVDGIFLLSLGNLVSVDDLVAYCAGYEPLPICTTTVPWKKYPRVLVDNEPGMRAGVRHLVEAHGRRRIAFVRGPEVSGEAELRFRVYREVLSEYGLPFDPRLVSPPGLFIIQDGVNAMRLLLDERKVTFDAVACVNDGAAMGVMQELASRGMVIPDEVAVLGFDDIDTSPYLDSPLTTVRQPIREQARQACLGLLAQMAGEAPADARPLPAELVVRESCGCAAYPTGAPALPVGAVADRELREALWSDVSTGEGSFLRKLGAAVEVAARRGGDIGGYQRVITLLQQDAFEIAGVGLDARRRANGLLHEARVRVSNARERTPAMQQLRFEELCHRLSRSNRFLTTAEDLAALTRASAEHLPELGVSSAYVCMYEGEAVPAEWARLVLAWDARRDLPLLPEGVLFRCREFLPEGFFPRDRRSDYVAFSLVREGDSPGYIVLERGAPEGVVYEALHVQFGAALGRFGLLDRVVEEARRREAADHERLEKEIEVARGIQTGIEPRNPRLAGMEIAARLLPAAELSGDYYDVIAVDDGGWIGMGGVTGRGLPTGLLMLMLQSVVSGLVRSNPAAAPSELLPFIHAVLVGDTRGLLVPQGRVSLSLFRYVEQGRLDFVGTHARVLVCRAGSGLPEWFSAASSSVPPSPVAQDTACHLQAGDLLVLCSEGLSNARDGHGRAFGVSRISALVLTLRHEPVEEICDALMREVQTWTATRQEDITVLVARRVGAPGRVGDDP
jgi:sigma-B regulation protein RsbU (phosphoserine phosphatase)